MRIGIYGGTFDPPHIGHINAFKAFLEQFCFDKVFVIPVFTPPHKCLKSSVSTDDRLNMTRLAFENLSENVEISDLEIKRQGKSYTADTIRYFKEEGYDDIYFLCGTDTSLIIFCLMPRLFLLDETMIKIMKKKLLAKLENMRKDLELKSLH